MTAKTEDTPFPSGRVFKAIYAIVGTIIPIVIGFLFSPPAVPLFCKGTPVAQTK